VDAIENRVERVEGGPRAWAWWRIPRPPLLGVVLGLIAIAVVASAVIRTSTRSPGSVSPSAGVDTANLSVYFDTSTWQVNSNGTGRVLVGGELGNSGDGAITVTGLSGVIPGGRLVGASYHGRPLDGRNAVTIAPGSSDIIWLELNISDCPTARTKPATLLVEGSSGQQHLSASISPGFTASKEPWLHDVLECGS